MAFRGWEVIYKDGTIASERTVDWKDVRKVEIKTLKLIYDNKCWAISDKDGYAQKKKASMVPGIPESFQVESRSIGFYEGNSKVWYTVDELTGIMRMNVQET